MVSLILFIAESYDEFCLKVHQLSPVTVSIGELTRGVFRLIFFVRAEVKSWNKRIFILTSTLPSRT